MVRKKVEEQKEESEKKKPLTKDYIHAVGRRRLAVARVRLYPKGSGEIVVNEKPAAEYFSLASQKILYERPFVVTDTMGKFMLTIKVAGGGTMGQLEAVIHGISRALEKLDKEKFHDPLKKNGLLTRDARARQRRMVGKGGKSRRKKQSPKR